MKKDVQLDNQLANFHMSENSHLTTKSLDTLQNGDI
jgi:hypothetical protein